MNWLNISTTSLDSEEFIGSDPVARATWLCLLRYCAGQENGGVIVNCRDWADRKWQQLARVTKAEIECQSDLWTWRDNDLVLWAYPIDSEAEVKAKREAGSKGGRSRTQAKIQAAQVNGAKQEPKQNPSTTQAEPKQEPNEKKGKERKGKGKEYIAPDGAPFALTNEADGVDKPKRARDPLLDALATVGGGKADEVTQWGPAIAAKAAIVAVTPNVTADDVRTRAQNYRSHFDGAALTPTALAKHWSVCVSPKVKIGNRTGVEQVAAERAAERPEWLQRAEAQGF